MYDLQNAEFVKVKDKFKNKKSGKDSAKVSSVCEKASQSFAGADFSKLGQTIPAGAHSFGAALGGAATAGAGAPMLTSAQSCGDTDAAPANWAQDTLYYIISKKEKSKKFTDVIPLDGGSIGIAHFAAGGLNSLYDAMGDETAKKYFGKTVSQLKSFSRGKNKCKGTTPMSKNDNGTGCYSVGWWKSGMEKFTASPESRAIQTKAWMDSKAGPGSERAKAHGWTTARQFAIAAGISNSMGVGGFTKLAEKVGWDAEKVLIGYTQGITIPSANDANKRHWTRRANLINSTFPCKNITTTPKADSTTVADTTESNTGEPPVDSGTTQAPT